MTLESKGCDAGSYFSKREYNINLIINKVISRVNTKVHMNQITLMQNINPKIEHSFVPYRKPESILPVEDNVKLEDLSSKDSD